MAIYIFLLILAIGNLLLGYAVFKINALLLLVKDIVVKEGDTIIETSENIDESFEGLVIRIKDIDLLLKCYGNKFQDTNLLMADYQASIESNLNDLRTEISSSINRLEQKKPQSAQMENLKEAFKPPVKAKKNERS